MNSATKPDSIYLLYCTHLGYRLKNCIKKGHHTKGSSFVAKLTRGLFVRARGGRGHPKFPFSLGKLERCKGTEEPHGFWRCRSLSDGIGILGEKKKKHLPPLPSEEGMGLRAARCPPCLAEPHGRSRTGPVGGEWQGRSRAPVTLWKFYILVSSVLPLSAKIQVLTAK